MNKKYSKENYIHEKQGYDINSDYWQGKADNICPVILKHYESYIKGKVVEFGCNNGVCVAKTSLLDPVTEVVGFDINPEAIQIAQSDIILNQIPSTRNKVKYVEANLTKIPWEKNYFDFAYTSHTLEHIYPDDIDDAVSEMSRLLKKGSYFLVNLPEKDSYHWCHDLHPYRPNMNELNSLFEEHGFETIECYLDQRGGQRVNINFDFASFSDNQKCGCKKPIIMNSTNITALYRKL